MVGFVDKACAAKSEAREELRGTPTSRCSAGRSIAAPENPPKSLLNTTRGAKRTSSALGS